MKVGGPYDGVPAADTVPATRNGHLIVCLQFGDGSVGFHLMAVSLVVFLGWCLGAWQRCLCVLVSR